MEKQNNVLFLISGVHWIEALTQQLEVPARNCTELRLGSLYLTWESLQALSLQLAFFSSQPSIFNLNNGSYQSGVQQRGATSASLH
jgi:hypothetical protein